MIKQVFGNNVLIDPIVEESEKSVGGIIVPGKKGQQKQLGKVVATGKGLLLEDGTRAPMDVQEGMTIIYRAYAGTPILDTDGRKYLVMDAKDVMAQV